ncbi:sugar ABC transporter substrate-binding protein [Leucobacter celer]|uniref:sugar ABC transporter substrate-binding protein n=1 Tax=Leucobacter celer TaxID=668625 RepID=UPI0006A75D28|nr:sugar ABC transporter substrate-binding protein [Leucobacter celer]
MKTRPIIVASVIAAALALSGCQASGDTGSDAQGGGSGAGQLQLGFSIAQSGLSFAQEMADGGQAAADLAGNVELTVSGPTAFDPPQQVKLLEDLARVGAADGIAVENLSPELFVRPLADLAAKDRALVAVDTVPLDGSNVDLYVGNDNLGAGRALAEAVLEEVPEDATGTVVIGTTIPGVSVLDARGEGIAEAVAELRPNLTVVGPLETKSEPAQNNDNWTNLVKSNPDAVAFIGTGELDAISLGKIHSTQSGDWFAGGFDPSTDGLASLEAGDLTAIVSPEHYLKGYVAISLLAAAAGDASALPKGWIDAGYLLIDSSNVAEVTERQKSDEAKRAWFADRAAEVVANVEKYTRPLADAR